MFYIYVLWSTKINKRYIGSTQDVKKRLKEHNRGSNKFTKGGKPWKVVYTEAYDTKSKALKREIFLKSGIGRKWLDENL
jgi:putative endonuclease